MKVILIILFSLLIIIVGFIVFLFGSRKFLFDDTRDKKNVSEVKKNNFLRQFEVEISL